MTAGRKRTFDKEEALDKAMRLFWENGYCGTSLTDLTMTLGINKPSLYAAFGNKEKLFQASIEHYMSAYGPSMQQQKDAAEKPLKDKLSDYLYNRIDAQTDSKTPKGCFFVKSRCESGSVAFPVGLSTTLVELGVAREKILFELLKDDFSRGVFQGFQENDIIGYLLSIMHGLAVQARNGKTRKELKAIADIFISTFPGTDS